MNWDIDNSKKVQRTFAEWAKKHPRELVACLKNLAQVQTLLRTFGDTTKFHVNYFRSEHHNVWRIGQTNVPHAHETRLYIYLYVSEQTIFPLRIGDKKSQQTDIQECYRLANEIKKEQTTKH